MQAFWFRLLVDINIDELSSTEVRPLASALDAEPLQSSESRLGIHPSPPPHVPQCRPQTRLPPQPLPPIRPLRLLRILPLHPQHLSFTGSTSVGQRRPLAQTKT